MGEVTPPTRRERIAILGARGMSNYGGFETFVAELAPRLTLAGYDLFVSHRMQSPAQRSNETEGIRILYFPLRFPTSSRLGRLFEVLYDWYFVLVCAFFIHCRIIYCLGIAGGPVLPVAKVAGSVTVLNLDGLEWKRPKFRYIERLYIRVAFLASYVFSDRLILDNGQLLNHIPEIAKSKASVIPYGTSQRDCPEWNREELGRIVGRSRKVLEPGQFWLVVARLEPDNSIHTIVEAYSRSQSNLPLVIVGDFSTAHYRKRVTDTIRSLGIEEEVLLVGSVYDQHILLMLRCNCVAHIHGHSVGGTNPSLLEAMSVGNVILAHDNAFNREVCGQNALYFANADELAREMASVESRRGDYAFLGKGARERAVDHYRWDDVVRSYDALFRRLLGPL